MRLKTNSIMTESEKDNILDDESKGISNEINTKSTDSADKKQKKVKKPVRFTVDWPYQDFTREFNPILKKNRIPFIAINVLKIWIKRFVFYKDPDPEWFSISLNNDRVVADFKFELDALRCEKLFLDIKNFGFPKKQEF